MAGTGAARLSVSASLTFPRTCSINGVSANGKVNPFPLGLLKCSAEANGGAPALKAIGAPIPQVRFCPTGGVSLKNAGDYLSLPNTVCVGGSWVAPANLVAARDWDAITALATQAAALPR